MTIMTDYTPGTPCWVDLMAKDMKAAQTFYGELFGWQCQAQDTQDGPPYGIFTFNGRGVAGIGQMSEDMKSQGMPAAWNTYVAVADVKAAAEKASSLGGTVTMAPMQVMDAGWMAFLKDPTGAHFAIWQKNKHFGAELANEAGSFGWNELLTGDVAKAKEFYGGLFDWGWGSMEMPDGRTYHMIKNGDRDVAGMMELGEDMKNVPPHWLTYFIVNGCDASTKRVESLGGSVLMPGMDIPPGRFSIVSDPQGAVFALFESKA